MSNASSVQALTYDCINPHIKEAKYAVRGELAVRSEKCRAQLLKGAKGDLPFDTVVSANIGNPQQLDQKPITFFRQVASILENPLLLEKEDVLKDALGYKQDVIDRAKTLLKYVKSVGAYSQSHGSPGIRESVAKFIESRSRVDNPACRALLIMSVQSATATPRMQSTYISRTALPAVSTLSSTSYALSQRPASLFPYHSIRYTPQLCPYSTPAAYHTTWTSHTHGVQTWERSNPR